MFKVPANIQLGFFIAEEVFSSISLGGQGEWSCS